ncbi:transcription factor UNE10-like [Solanum dulcamara]|uniref:transcription factor UNE10-like n=1 Tax=Solanum dulcamara TaxID=45834 RepID=UPI00248559C8|nr:transcription factor UNE10-like [Solanum dulcamara]
MTQCVPSWRLDGSPSHLNLVLSSHSNSNNSFVTDAPKMDYEVTELTWENGQLTIHSLGPPRVPNKRLPSSSPTTYPWANKPHAGGTHESIVNQATTSIPHHQKSPLDGGGDRGDDFVSCRRDTIETGERSLGAEKLTATAMGSPENTSKTVNDHYFIPHSRAQHNRGSFGRDKINQRMKTLPKLVPTSSKTDKASMLDEVIEYLKQLQAQVTAMSGMIHVNMPPPMMLPNMALQQQQQLQMSMMGRARPMDVNALSRPNITTMPSVLHATAPSFNMPMASPAGASPPSVVPDPVASLLGAGQSQPMTMDAYSRMVALYQ